MQTNNINVLLNVYWFELNYFLGPLSAKGKVFNVYSEKEIEGY